MKIALTLFHTQQCHLCEMALALCQTVLNPEFFALVLVDIVDSDAFVDRYGTRIPVLRVDSDGRELAWPFDIEQLIQFLS